MPLHFELKMMNKVVFDRYFDRFLANVKSFKHPFEKITKRWARSNKTAFDNQGAVESHPKWKDLKISTVIKKFNKGMKQPGRILYGWGNLYKSMQLKDELTSIKVIRDHAMEIGTKLPYAMYHQTGAGRLPKREPMIVSKKDQHKYAQYIHRYLYETFKNQGKFKGDTAE